jgi:hypothetical protein
MAGGAVARARIGRGVRWRKTPTTVAAVAIMMMLTVGVAESGCVATWWVSRDDPINPMNVPAMMPSEANTARCSAC